MYGKGEKMMQTVWAVIHRGRARALVGLFCPMTPSCAEDERQFWLKASERSLSGAIWDGAEDDAYVR